jgi:hypothetical protein
MLGERVLIARLEEENQEILREMQSLEEQQVRIFKYLLKISELL